MEKDLYRVIYLSQVDRDLFDSKALSDILNSARENNHKLGITGMLICDYYHFLQALEGERDKVTAMYEVIASDERHSDVRLIEGISIAEREFGEWAMGFSRVIQSSSGKLSDLNATEATALLKVYARHRDSGEATS